MHAPEEKHRAWTDPGFIANDRAFAQKLQDDENRKEANRALFNQAFPPPRPNNPAPVIQPIFIPQANQNAEIARLQERLNKVEKEDQEMQDRIRNALIIENPRLLQAIYPRVNNIYNPSRIIDAAILAELSKKEQAEQTYRKLKELYGEDAPAKYLNRAIARIDAEYKPPQMVEPKPKPKPKQRTRSRSKSRSKSKSKPKKK